MNEPGLRRSLPDQSSGSGRSFGTPRHQSFTDPILSKRVCFYKSGDPQFSGLCMVINNRTFKTFDALLDSLSKKVPLPFGVRNITTPHGVHAVHTLDELEDGKSYICSDMRKVKPINLALVRRNLPPWYHARPVSSRRQMVHQSRSFPGQKIHKKQRAVLRTPKRLVVFCNGAPTVQHTLLLDKRITPTFESILEYISEVTQFHVVKLHTLDGRRVDGLPGLILCSGLVVAAGREPFRHANYNAQKFAAPVMLNSKRSSLRRLKSLNRQKKFLSYTPVSRKFSSSSERYIVNRIHDSITESSVDLPSNPTNSASMESGHVLELVAEGDVESQDCSLPTEDDIEKSFRVNQDGSMTVEMKVRLTIKEEETVHWTTTLSRSSVANQINGKSFEAEQIGSEVSQSMDLQSSAAAKDTINTDVSEENEEEPLPLCNGELSIKEHVQMSPQRTPPTPGTNCVRQKHASVESITSVSAEGIEEGTITSFSYKEKTEHESMTEQYCVFKQKSTRPVPKPRRFGSVDGNGRNISMFESAGMSEFLQIESSGDEVTETVLHMYEQQTCQDNFLANLSGVPFRRPSSSGHRDPPPEVRRPSTASESINMWRAENMMRKSDRVLPTVKTSKIQTTELTKRTDEAKRKEAGKDKKIASKSKVTNKLGRIMSPGKRQKQVKPLSAAGALKKNFGNKLRSAKSAKLSKQQTSKIDEKTFFSLEENKNDAPNNSSQPTHQPSEHQDGETTLLPTFDCPASATNKYVEKWLEQSHQQKYDEEERKRVHVAKVVKQLEITSETQTSQALKTEAFPDNVRRASVKQRILSFENKSSNPSAEQRSTQQQIIETETKLCHVSAQNNLGEIQPVSNHCCYENIPQAQEVSTESQNRLPIATLLHNATPSLSLSMDLPSPPPPDEMTELLSDEEGMIPPETSETYAKVSSGGGQMSDQPLSNSLIPDKLIASVDQMSEMTTSVQSEGSSMPLARTPSAKRVPFVSNFSFDRKMSLRKARLDKYTVSCDETPSTPNSKEGETVLPNIQQTRAAHVTSDAPMQESSTSRCSSAYPTSLESEGRMSTGSLSSNEVLAQSVQTSQTSKKDAPPKPPVTNVNPGSSVSPERKPKSKKISSELTHNSPTMSKHKSPKMTHVGEEKHITPNPRDSSKRKQLVPKAELPGSNHPLDNSDVTETKRRSSKGKSEQSPQMVRSAAHQNVSDRTESQVKPQQYNVENQPNMKPVLEELCNSIKSLRQMLQSRRLSCLEQSHSPLGFSSHIASMFGSSPKVLLAFLSVMTLKDGITDYYRDELNANAVSCAEALKTIDSLKEIAAIQDSHQLNGSLLDLQKSASNQLMESWKSFQEFYTKCKSSSSTSDSEQVSGAKAPERGSDDIIDEIMDKFDIPDELKVELASLSGEVTSNSDETEMIRDGSGSNKGHVTRSEDTHSPSVQEGSSEVERNELQIHKEESETVPENEESETEEEIHPGGAAPEEEPEEDSDGTSYERAGAGDDSSDPEGPSVDEEQSALNYYVELSARTSRPENGSTHVSKDEMTSLSSSEQARLNPTGRAEVEASADDSDMEEPDSEEELAEDQSVESKAIVRDVFEEQESAEELEEDINQHLHSKTDKSSLIISHRYSTDEDSGNDHNNCETNAEIEVPKVSSSTEEELSYYEKELSSEEEQLTVSRHSSREYQKTLLDAHSEGKICQNVANQIQDPAKEVISKSIAERVSLLEKQVAEAQRSRNATARPTVQCSSQRSSLLQSDGEDSESPSSELALASRSAPQSSLSFSYDSSAVITTEPERTRVKSIREMFLAKSATDTKQGNGTIRSPLPDLRAETSVSGGYQSQTSSDLSSAEDDSSHKSISKGLVRRTIERLYGKKDVIPEQESAKRPPSAPKQKKRDHSRIFSPFHSVRSKAGPEVSYFNSTNVLDTLSEATKCVGFNTQVRPDESLPCDNGQWLIRKSVSDPVGINQSLTTTPQAGEIFEDTSEKTPYSLFELEDKDSAQRKCTYFSLPHGSESDACQDEASTVSSTNGDTVADTTDPSKDSKTWAERNGVLPAVGITDFKKMDNKVHPLVEPPPDGEVVLAQPVRGHGAVIRRAPDPDVLDLLYNFCGQNCPIL